MQYIIMGKLRLASSRDSSNFGDDVTNGAVTAVRSLKRIQLFARYLPTHLLDSDHALCHGRMFKYREIDKRPNRCFGIK